MICGGKVTENRYYNVEFANICMCVHIWLTVKVPDFYPYSSKGIISAIYLETVILLVLISEVRHSFISNAPHTSMLQLFAKRES